MNLPEYKNMFYETYKHNIYSQEGEDGIINELLKRLNITSGSVVEFGAWDGIHLSNTFQLVEKGFNAVFIEGDIDKFAALNNTAAMYPNIIPVHKFVSYDNATDSSLENILSKTSIPLDFDVLSIDIDSSDYLVWKEFGKYKPKIVIIEIDSSVDPSCKHHIHNGTTHNGSSFYPTLYLGIEKGYKFLCHTGNMIFVRNDLYESLNIPDYNDPVENFRRSWCAKMLPCPTVTCTNTTNSTALLSKQAD